MERAAGSGVSASTALAVTPPPGAAAVPRGCGAGAVTQAASKEPTARGASGSVTAPATSPATRPRGAACAPPAKPAPRVLQTAGPPASGPTASWPASVPPAAPSAMPGTGSASAWTATRDPPAGKPCSPCHPPGHHHPQRGSGRRRSSTPLV